MTGSPPSRRAGAPARLLRGLDRALDAATIALLAVLLTVVGAQVFARYVLNRSLFWSEELARYLFVYLVFLGAAIGLGRRRHIQVSVVAERLPARWRRAVAGVVELLLLGFVGTVFWQSLRLMRLVWTVPTAALLIPWSVVYLGISLGMGVMLVMQVARLWGHLAGDGGDDRGW